ncbi:hypothetical protein F4778DRAFT_391890 [Xylariomycetidae sp. FL2044]|nr:hypothetical protein F4778DRAFT_391890 [Xylariomycetidae sp. FL2044]
MVELVNPVPTCQAPEPYELYKLIDFLEHPAPTLRTRDDHLRNRNDCKHCRQLSQPFKDYRHVFQYNENYNDNEGLYNYDVFFEPPRFHMNLERDPTLVSWVYIAKLIHYLVWDSGFEALETKFTGNRWNSNYTAQMQRLAERVTTRSPKKEYSFLVANLHLVYDERTKADIKAFLSAAEKLYVRWGKGRVFFSFGGNGKDCKVIELVNSASDSQADEAQIISQTTAVTEADSVSGTEGAHGFQQSQESSWVGESQETRDTVEDSLATLSVTESETSYGHGEDSQDEEWHH